MLHQVARKFRRLPRVGERMPGLDQIRRVIGPQLGDGRAKPVTVFGDISIDARQIRPALLGVGLRRRR